MKIPGTLKPARGVVGPGNVSHDVGTGEGGSTVSAAGFVHGVEVLWRPGCPFCMNLRRGLRRRGVVTTEIDIWEDPDAAARVRAVTGGDETVPTVFVGSRALVNPSVRDVVAAIEQEFPGRVQELAGGATTCSRRPWWSRLFRGGAGDEGGPAG